jgi:imidazolonepropionase-like amidohydrolase
VWCQRPRRRERFNDSFLPLARVLSRAWFARLSTSKLLPLRSAGAVIHSFDSARATRELETTRRWSPFRRLAAIAAVLLLTTSRAAAQTAALVGGTVIDGSGKPGIPNAVVVVTRDRLACVGTAEQCPVPRGATRVDVTGRFLTPGLVDAHVHFSQTGWVDGRPDGISAPALYPYAETARALRANPSRWYRSYLCSGVTAVYDVGGHPWTTALPAQAERDSMAPHVRAAGPLLTYAPARALDVDDEIYTFLPMATSADVRASVARLKAMGASAVKVLYLASAPAQQREHDARLAEVGAAARAAGLDLIVHATELRGAKAALRAGAVMLVHSVEDEPLDDEFITLLQTTRAIYAPTLLVGRNAVRAFAAIILGTRDPIDDPGGCVDSNTVAKTEAVAPLRLLIKDFTRASERVLRGLDAADVRSAMMADNLRRVYAMGATIVVGTDAGNPLEFHGPSIFSEMEAMQAAGLSAADIVVMATRNGAQALGRLKDFGTLDAGKLADLLVLTEDPRKDVRAFRSLTHVMRGGRLFARAALAQLN